MHIIDSIKSAGKNLLNWMKGESKATPTWTPAPPADTSRYHFVSVPLVPVDNEMLATITGQRYIPQRGITCRSLRGECRRQADALATELGYNNKARRRLRAKILARATELQREQAA